MHRGEVRQKLTLVDKGGAVPSFFADIICEQPLIFQTSSIMMFTSFSTQQFLLQYMPKQISRFSSCMCCMFCSEKSKCTYFCSYICFLSIKPGPLCIQPDGPLSLTTPPQAVKVLGAPLHSLCAQGDGFCNGAGTGDWLGEELGGWRVDQAKILKV